MNISPNESSSPSTKPAQRWTWKHTLLIALGAVMAWMTFGTGDSTPNSTTASNNTAALQNDPEARYLSLAQNTSPPVVRPQGDGKNQWKVDTIAPGDVQITFPMTVGATNEQTVRIGKQKIAQIVNSLFSEEPDLTRINVIGTTPLGDSESPAISIVVERGSTEWGSVPVEQLDKTAKYKVSQRLQ